jgi:carboxypeptidase Q
MEYQSHTWHTNLDTYERIIEDDVKAQAAVIAAVVHALATREDRLPRFAPEQMPKPVTPAPTPAPAPPTTASK